jgi:hypothetical protein
MNINNPDNCRVTDLAQPTQPRKKNMYDLIFVGAFVAFWLLLQMVILPRFGVRT